MTKVKSSLHNYLETLKSIPGILLALFITTVVVMNILAKKTIFQNDYIAIDGGIFVTWIAVIISDIVTIVCGPKATIKMTVFAILVSLFASSMFRLVAAIPGASDMEAFNQVLGGTWFIILSSAIAFICSNSFDAFVNYCIGKAFKEKSKSKLAVAVRIEGSTVISTIFDNMIFNVLTFMVFAPIFWNGFHWTAVQCICCALVYGAIEIVIEAIMFPLTYKGIVRLNNNVKA